MDLSWPERNDPKYPEDPHTHVLRVLTQSEREKAKKILQTPVPALEERMFKYGMCRDARCPDYGKPLPPLIQRGKNRCTACYLRLVFEPTTATPHEQFRNALIAALKKNRKAKT